MLRHSVLLTVVTFFFVPGHSLGSERFQLESEIRNNFTATGPTEFLTVYSYDAKGNRVQSRVWSGSDSVAEHMSSVNFIYNDNGDRTGEIFLSGNDTVTIVRFAYDDGKLCSVRTLKKDGTLRFIDSLIYDGQGRKIEERRISSSGVTTFFHQYTLNAQGKTVADSLYELGASSYEATQAVLFTYNPDSTVAKETQWRLSAASWYCISTAFMSYAAGTLVSVATRERDGVGTGMTDSLSYAYDTHGNRIREEGYDGSGVMTHRIAYSWRDMQTSIAIMNDKIRNSQKIILGDKHGRLMVDLTPQDHGVITLYTMAGKRMCRMTVNHSGIVPLNGLAGKGSYIAVFTGEKNRQVINFKNYN